MYDNENQPYEPDEDEGGVPMSEGTPEYGGPPMTMRELVQAEDAAPVREHATPVGIARDGNGRLVVVCDDGTAYMFDEHYENGHRWEPLPPVPGSRIWDILEGPPDE